MISQDSANFWMPRLQLHPDPWFQAFIPQTAMAAYDEELLAPSLRGQESDEYERLYFAVEKVIGLAFRFPVFIRTDITSAKHAGRKAYIVSNYDELNDALLITLGASQLKTYFQKIKGSAIMIRPVIDIAATRTAFHGLPIGKEWRVFADQRGVQCVHSYWPTEALEGYMDDGNSPDVGRRPEIIDAQALLAAKIAAKLMGQLKWSIDFARDKDGKTWLLDMATAANSYHAKDCKFFGLDSMERI